MLVLTKIICNIIINFFGFFIIKTLKNDQENNLDFQKIVVIVFFSILTSLFTVTSYQIITPLFSYFLLIIMYKLLFHIKISEATVITGVFFIFICISEIILLPIVFSIFPNGESKTIPTIMLISNIIIGVTSLSISKISKINKLCNRLLEKLENTKIQKMITFVILTIIVISIIFSLIADIYEFSEESFIYFLTILIFIVLFIIYISEQNEYITLTSKYDQLLKYVIEFENWVDEVELEKHEYKNDLAVLETKVHDKEVKKFIDEKLNRKLLANEGFGNSLKEMPNGGMKGLLYYKIIFAKNNHINLKIDISKNIKKYFKNLSNEEYKLLCHLFGIYLDNAIEAAMKSKERSMSVEIYELQNELNIVISNSFNGKLELYKLNEKGYTSKGKGRGSGLYFANEIIKQTNKINSNNRICNNYYIQRLKINEK